ncbi:phosphate ABC transporter permease subunit PstC [Actinospica robiniae]|uniref:phosphate ABC transporter permease subunit PstC n=1 Tax=Actinospica robiniae TaxID=304901 RepID=UPI000400A02F|nr:phosphate ABC transporter permease subunit PstC [Actinospica robiniae]
MSNERRSAVADTDEVAVRDPRAGLAAKAGIGDRLFGGSARGAAVFILILMAAIAGFLIFQAVEAIGKDKVDFVTSFTWDPDGNSTPNGVAQFGIAAIAWGTLVTSVIGVLLGAPVAIGVALFITQYAPRRLGAVFGYIVDLLAAVPSVVYGLWGLLVLDTHMAGVSKIIQDVLGWIPMFKSDGTYGSSVFTAGVVLAIMILPIIAAIAREIYKQTPREQVEAAYALGATRWEMIRLAVLPYGRSGVTSAVILGFGRALGETIAVAMVLTQVPGLVTRILQPGGNTIAANIAVQFGDAFTTGRQALIASGLVLFLMTLIVNYAARVVVRRAGKAGS